MFDRVLIANRGEIACRVIRTCRRLGLRTVAVYSQADRDARHVRLADAACCIGAAAARESYLSIDRLLAAAAQTGADAIHPGYGFLAESPAFAERCAAAGLTFIGPPASAMRALGSKAAAKRLMEDAGVPLLPGYHGPEQEAAGLRAQAMRVGYPLLIKAVAGGGGRGMRLVERAADFEAQLAACRREAEAGFGDAQVLLERYLPRARHIEVQVFGDRHGGLVHLFERDCSAQRRQQKILEEAPAAELDAPQRARVCELACRAARAGGYHGAGTCEFLFDGLEFYFLEMNTRIQVEHPVTEMITGIDLIEWQLRIAAGEPLPLAQKQIRCAGHAVEVRLYAETPEAGFLPSGGRLTCLELPRASQALRLEFGVEAGENVGIHYDPLLGKLIALAPTRGQALAAVHEALCEVRVQGVATNLTLLRQLTASRALRDGAIDVGFIGREAAAWFTPPEPPPLVLAAAALETMRRERQRSIRAPGSPWSGADGWRLNGPHRRGLQFEWGGASGGSARVEVEYRPDPMHGPPEASDPSGLRGLRLRLGAREQEAALCVEGSYRVVRWGEEAARLLIEPEEEIGREPAGWRICQGETVYRLRLPRPGVIRREQSPASAPLVAPMPGRIIALLAQPGERVRAGTPLLILEAMKMEHSLCAPGDGVLQEYRVELGTQVGAGEELIRFSAADDAADDGTDDAGETGRANADRRDAP